MAFATCRSCHRGANEYPCPHCGGDMYCDEIYEPDEGGAYPMLKRPDPPPEGDFARAIREDREAGRKQRFAEAVRQIEEKFQRPATPLEKAVATIEAQFGKGSIRVGNQLNAQPGDRGDSKGPGRRASGDR